MVGIVCFIIHAQMSHYASVANTKGTYSVSSEVEVLAASLEEEAVKYRCLLKRTAIY